MTGFSKFSDVNLLPLLDHEIEGLLSEVKAFIKEQLLTGDV